MDVTDRLPPALALAVAVAAVSTSAILVRWSSAPSIVIALYRVALTLALLVPFAVPSLGSLRELTRTDIVLAAGAGAALAAHFVVWFESLRYTSVAASVTLVQSQPLFVAVGATLLLGERLSRQRALGIAIAVGGMATMSAGALGDQSFGHNPLLGEGLAVLGAVFAAGYLLVGRSVRQQVPLLAYVLVVYGCCVVVLLATALSQAVPLGGYPQREWLLFLGMAVGPGIFGHTVINWALARVDSSVVSVSLLGEPVGSTLLALVLLGEIPAVWTVGGGAVVLAGIHLTARG